MAKLSPKRKCWVQMVSIQQEAAKKGSSQGGRKDRKEIRICCRLATGCLE
jgi:hypothetical protein